MDENVSFRRYSTVATVDVPIDEPESTVALVDLCVNGGGGASTTLEYYEWTACPERGEALRRVVSMLVEKTGMHATRVRPLVEALIANRRILHLLVALDESQQ